METNNGDKKSADSLRKTTIKLVVLSFFVGVVLAGLGLQPEDVPMIAASIARRIWNMGFGVFWTILDCLLVGAAVVVPVFLAIRLAEWLKRPKTDRS